MPKSFRSKFLGLIFLLSLAVAFKLLLVAESTGNWRGFFYSMLHVSIVAGASYFLLKDCSMAACQEEFGKNKSSKNS